MSVVGLVPCRSGEIVCATGLCALKIPQQSKIGYKEEFEFPALPWQTSVEIQPSLGLVLLSSTFVRVLKAKVAKLDALC